MTRRAAPVVLAATSGTGKTTLAHRLVDGPGCYVFSVSATTRAPRPGERDGVDYHFLSREAFEARVRDHWFAEWASVHDHWYGTPRTELDEAASRGEHVVLDIDIQGARQIRQTVPDATLIFVLPPSLDTMMRRLTGRGTEEARDIARRLETALDELHAAHEFDYVVVNDELDDCLADIRGIVERDEAPAPPEQDAESMRRGIVELLDSVYGTYRQDSESE